MSSSPGICLSFAVLEFSDVYFCLTLYARPEKVLSGRPNLKVAVVDLNIFCLVKKSCSSSLKNVENTYIDDSEKKTSGKKGKLNVWGGGG